VPVLLTITTAHEPATELGFLLHKNPGAVHERELSFGVGNSCIAVGGDANAMSSFTLAEVSP